MTRRCDFPRLPDEPERLGWSEWLGRHGIDPRDVAVAPGWIEADDDSRTITYLALPRDDKGQMQLDRRGCPRHKPTGADGRPCMCDVVKEPRYVQLEAHALPFPVGA